MSAIICIENILHGNEIIQYLKNYKATKLIKTILKNTYKVVSGTYNLAAPTRPIYLLRAVKF